MRARKQLVGRMAGGALVAGAFIESHIAHPFIARLLQVFIAIAPIALVLTGFFGDTVARWATL